MRVGVVTGWEPRGNAGPKPDFLLRKPVRTSDLLSQVAVTTARDVLPDGGERRDAASANISADS
jgi:hypothetical protein